MSVGNECRHTLLSAQYLHNGFTCGAVCVLGDLSRVPDGLRCR